MEINHSSSTYCTPTRHVKKRDCFCLKHFYLSNPTCTLSLKNILLILHLQLCNVYFCFSWLQQNSQHSRMYPVFHFWLKYVLRKLLFKTGTDTYSCGISQVELIAHVLYKFCICIKTGKTYTQHWAGVSELGHFSTLRSKDYNEMKATAPSTPWSSCCHQTSLYFQSD